MTHTSPTSFAVWSILSTALGAFLLGHLYRFDKFKCLKWTNTPYSGAFKRIMTYSYLITIPLIMIYSFGFTYIKYKEGFADIAGGIFPTPYNFWKKEYRDAIFPLMMIFAFAWSFEMVTHLEELCFWYFLITAGPAQPDWFRSVYFRIWVLGSLTALIYLPVVTIVHRENPLSCEARMFTAGSAGDLGLTLGFIPILFCFPDFIRKVKAEGVDSSIIVRLRKFYELNVIRIIFRFLMQIPLLTLGIDGLKPHSHEINESLFWTDLLSTVAALGCVFSSVCTLLIFFPRSCEAEYRAKEASHHRHSTHSVNSRQSHEPQPAHSQYGGDDEFNSHHHGDHNAFNSVGLRKSRSFNSIQKFSSDAGHYEEDYNYDDPAAKPDDERKVGIGLMRERFGSKLRERERRITRGTKNFGYGLQDAFSRQFMRLPRAMRRGGRGDTEGGSSGISRSRSTEREGRDTETRRTTPSSRSAARKMSGNGSVDNEFPVTGASAGAGAGAEMEPKLERKGTYLLSDSPVLRAQRLHARQQEELRCVCGGIAAASVENLEAACEVSAGAGEAIDEPISTSPIGTEIAYGTTTTSSRLAQESCAASGLGLASQYLHDKKVPPIPLEALAVRVSEDSNADIEELALDSPPPLPLSAAPSYAQATGMHSLSPTRTSPTSPNANHAIASANSPTGHGHAHGPRVIEKSISISTTGTTATANRRALPIPPLGDPLGAAPAYYSPENSPFVTTQSHGQNSNDPQDRNVSGALGKVCSPPPPSSSAAVGNLSTHAFASAQPAVSQGRHKSTAIDILPQSSDMAMRETADAAPLGVCSHYVTSPYLSSLYPQHGGRPNASGTNASALTAVDSDMRTLASGGTGTGMGLTTANLARLNRGGGAVRFTSRSSQVNPLVRTFTSPIDFLDRIQENDSNGSPV